MTFTHGECNGPGWIDDYWSGVYSFSKYDSEEEYNFGL